MRTVVLAFVLALAPAVGARALDLPVKLRDGAAWTQTTVHSRTDVRGGATTSMTATSVIKTTYRKDGSLRQDFVSFQVDGVRAEEMKGLTEQAKMIYPAEIEVDEALQPTRVRDWPRVRELISQAIAATTTDPRAQDQARAMFAQMNDTQAAALFKEQGLVSLGQGTGLGLGEARTYDSEVPNLLGGPAIKASGAFRLEAVDKAKGVAIVTWSQTPDPAALAASLRVTLEGMLARLPAEKQPEAKARFATMTMERQERCRYEIDLVTGLARTADCNVELKSGLPGQLAQRTDRWVITQSQPEPR